MAKHSGRNLVIKRMVGTVYTAIAAVTSKSVEINNSGVDITTDDSDGWQTYLAEPGTRAVNLLISGVTDDEELLTAIMASTGSIVLEDIQILFSSGTTLTGDFQFSSISFSGEKDGACVFECKMSSSGQVVKA